MNKNALLDLVLAEHAEKAPWVRPRSLRSLLFQAYSRKDIEPPPGLGKLKLPGRLERLVAHFDSDVALCSAVLYWYAPDRYVL